jgi:hypothetical protein
LSFFDEVDEPPRTEQRRAPRAGTRTAPPRRRSSGGGGTGRRPPSSQQQSIQTRRAVLGVILVIFVILIAVGVHSCQVSSDQNALKDYVGTVSALVTRSDQTGRVLFQTLSSASGSSNGVSIHQQITNTRQTAVQILNSARSNSAPDSVKTANAHFLLALQMRVDGITNIADEIEGAVSGGSASASAVQSIAGQMARFYASDVLYKDYTVTDLVSALHTNGIPVSGRVNGGQFVTDVQWLVPSHVAGVLNVNLPSSATSGGGNTAQGCSSSSPCGHTLNSVSVNGTTLQTGSPNTIPDKPAPTFKLDVTNGGSKSEANVVCKVTVNGTSVSGTATIPETTAGQATSCSVPLKSSPAAGTYTVEATVEKVPGESNTSNNSQGYTVTFQ